MPNTVIARKTELQVAAFLTRRGFTIHAHNLRHIGFELDLLASKNKILSVVEVKARGKRTALSEPDRLLPKRKVLALRKGALYFLERTQEYFETIQLDLAVVATNKPGLCICYYENVYSDWFSSDVSSTGVVMPDAPSRAP